MRTGAVGSRRVYYLPAASVPGGSSGAYKSTLTDSCGMEELRQVYQDAYDRYKKTAQE